MGAFLDTPITEKETKSGVGNGLVFATSTMQGWRSSMEVRRTFVFVLGGYSYFHEQLITPPKT